MQLLLSIQIPDISIVRKMFQKMIADQFSGQIPDKFWTKTNARKRSFSGTFSGQWKCPEFVWLIFWTISGQFPDTLFS